MGRSEVPLTTKSLERPGRIQEVRELRGRRMVLREARPEDAPRIASLFNDVYRGAYPLDYGNPDLLRAEIVDTDHYLWIVGEPEGGEVVGAMAFHFDTLRRLAKSGGGVVLPDYREGGLASTLLSIGSLWLTETQNLVDLVYGTSRTVSEGPARMTAEAGFVLTGIFPNAIQVERVEHLNLDVFLTKRCLEQRRRRPALSAPFLPIYEIAARQLGLEEATVATQRPLDPPGKRERLTLVEDRDLVVIKYRAYLEQRRLANSFFPFALPNWMLTTEDGGSDIFLSYGGRGGQAAIIGYRTDRAYLRDLFESVAETVQRAGAAYLEMVVSAFDPGLQQQVFHARFLPCAYFPAMQLDRDGLRDDYFVVSRTFRILDLTGSVVKGENLNYLRAYLRSYYQLYIEPILGPLAQQSTFLQKSTGK